MTGGFYDQGTLKKNVLAAAKRFFFFLFYLLLLSMMAHQLTQCKALQGGSEHRLYFLKNCMMRWF